MITLGIIAGCFLSLWIVFSIGVRAGENKITSEVLFVLPRTVTDSAMRGRFLREMVDLRKAGVAAPSAKLEDK